MENQSYQRVEGAVWERLLFLGTINTFTNASLVKVNDFVNSKIENRSSFFQRRSVFYFTCYSIYLFFKLLGIKFRIRTLMYHQLFVCALFHNLSFREYDNSFSIPDRRQSMCNDYRCTSIG